MIFYKDLERVYQLTQERDEYIQSFYLALDTQNPKRDFLDSFLSENSIYITQESRYAIANRLVALRDDSLVQILKQDGYSKESIIELKERAYLWVSEFYLKEHQKLIEKIESENLLTQFYREVLKGVHRVGVAMSSWQSSWTAEIINGVNRELYQLFNGDEERIFEMLNRKNLLDRGHNQEIGDRSYSMLIDRDGEFKSIAYRDAFESEVQEVLRAIAEFKVALFPLKDEVFDKKSEYIDYLDALELALSESDTDRLISRWADVDRVWMRIDTPLQIGHPLEYYEDHYRKAVALEWDLRLSDPNAKSERVQKIKYMYREMFESFDSSEYERVYDLTLKNLDRVKLFLGRPMLYYGAEFSGLFSAQVVPNDEIVSKECGKKIFAFADNILQSVRAKPFMKLPRVIFGDEFVKRERKFLMQEDELWHRVYDITTIGHEYGHTLWMDSDSESLMNLNGNFKNIEEFKATAGGLVSFFMSEEEELKERVLIDTLKRAVGLIAWMEVDEVKPYYCEGLIHLKAMFDSKVLTFERAKVEVDISNYESLKSWYMNVYSQLARHYYLPKRDANEFLYQFVDKSERNFLPKDSVIREFVEYYYSLYKKIGAEIDREDSKENYVRETL